MTTSGSSKPSSSSEQVGVEIVYLKDNVAIHPTQHAWERIRGRLKLIKQGSSLLMVSRFHASLDSFLCMTNFKYSLS